MMGIRRIFPRLLLLLPIYDVVVVLAKPIFFMRSSLWVQCCCLGMWTYVALRKILFFFEQVVLMLDIYIKLEVCALFDIL